MKKYVVIVILLIAIIFTIYFILSKNEYISVFNNIDEVENKEKILSNVQTEVADITKYYIYGTHLNIEGNLLINNDKLDNIENIELVLDDSYNTVSYKVEYTVDNNITFYTSENINGGIDLEELAIGDFVLLLKITYIDDDGITQNEYYTFNNNTEYTDLEYYTLTRNDTNNKIELKFMSYTIAENSIPCVNLNVDIANNTANVYDIVIDPGHGGDDIGASAKGYYESEITLEYALELKEKLEEAGLKVLLTREDNEDRVDAYGENGRAVIPNKVNAKYSISLHLNSNESNMLKGGIEVYAPSNADLTFAKLIADNIVSYANTSYSSQISYKEENGVYVKNFSESDIKESIAYAKENNYESYNITTETPYLYMIREVGGIATNAYIDGRNSIYGINEYYNSNKTAEGYLIELGYMNVSSDLNNLLNNMDSYVQAISNSITQYCKLR